MAIRKKYTARYTYEDGTWIVRVVEANGVHSHGRTIERARANARDALSLKIGKAAFSVELVDQIELPSPARRAVARHQRTSQRAQTELQQARSATRAAAAALLDCGLSNRDAGTVLGVSRQRIHQLLTEE